MLDNPLYHAFKDFAGPLATIVAASAAAFVTYRIQRQNHDLATRRLAVDLFDKRYRIYAAARDLLILMQTAYDEESPETKTQITGHYIAMAEAPFLCSKEAEAFCLKVKDARQEKLAAQTMLKLQNQIESADERLRATRRWTEANMRVLRLSDEVVAAFAQDLTLK